MTDESNQPIADWYFDFISPFAYLQHELLRRRAKLQRRYRPVLLGGLLRHWGNKGPAEIPSKRRLTYEHCVWLAEKHGVAMRFPAVHPFHPLPALRLAIACGAGEGDDDEATVTAVFRAIWAEGGDLSEAAVWDGLCRRLGFDGEEGRRRIADAEVKAKLRANTEAAAAAGVFGVPTIVLRGRMFWGADMTEMAVELAADARRFAGGEYARLEGVRWGIG